VKPDRQPHEAVKQFLSNVGDHLVTDIAHQIGLPVTKERFQYRDPEEGERQDQKQRLIFVDKDSIQDGPNKPGIGARQDRNHGGAQKGCNEATSVRRHVTKQSPKSI
jgi:hypothetical protein